MDELEKVLGEIIVETEEAYLFQCNEREEWVAKIHVENVDLIDGADELTIPLWLAEKLEFV